MAAAIQRMGQQAFEQLRQNSPDPAADFVRLCSLCALEALGWLPNPQDPCWQGLWQEQNFDRHANAALAHLHKALPQLFDGKAELQPQWFAPEGAACLLRQIYRSRPPEDRLGLAARLWEGCAEPLRRQSFADLRRRKHHTGKNAAYATQLFTPDWLACFLTQNSLGRMVGVEPHHCYYMGEAPDHMTACPRDITLLDPVPAAASCFAVPLTCCTHSWRQGV